MVLLVLLATLLYTKDLGVNRYGDVISFNIGCGY